MSLVSRLPVLITSLSRFNDDLEAELLQSGPCATCKTLHDALKQLECECIRASRLVASSVAHRGGTQLNHLPAEVLLSILMVLPPHVIGLLDSTCRLSLNSNPTFNQPPRLEVMTLTFIIEGASTARLLRLHWLPPHARGELNALDICHR